MAEHGHDYVLPRDTMLFDPPVTTRGMTALILNPPTATPPFYALTTVDHGRFDFGATGYGSCPWECAANAVGGALDWLEGMEQPHLMVYRTRDGEAFIAEHGPWMAIERCPIAAAAFVLEAAARGDVKCG